MAGKSTNRPSTTNGSKFDPTPGTPGMKTANKDGATPETPETPGSEFQEYYSGNSGNTLYFRSSRSDLKNHPQIEEQKHTQNSHVRRTQSGTRDGASSSAFISCFHSRSSWSWV